MCEENNEPLTEFEKEHNKIEDMRTDADFARDRFLRRHGWQSVCNTPGSCWLWERKLRDGRTVLVSAELAFSMTENLYYCGELAKAPTTA
jgi:hypothetical protein